MSLDQTAPVIIVSADSHVGPRLREDLRGYCPARRLDDYDALIAQTGPIVNGQALLGHPNAGPGHYDPAARLADMDSDGVAAEVIYHGSQNGEPLPWGGSAKFGIGTFDAFDSSLLELTELGCDIYDRWLADFRSADPKRLLGLFHIPAWDIGKSAEVVKRAAAAGLTGVNFPVCGRAGIRPYNDPAWDPFWAACVENGITLHTHGNGAPIFDSATGPGAEEIIISDVGGWTSRRAAHYLIYGQVFDRFPGLTLVITEIEEQWYQSTQWALDSQYRRFGHTPLKKDLPSAYFPTNVYMGASFMSPTQAVEASRDGTPAMSSGAATTRTWKAPTRPATSQSRSTWSHCAMSCPGSRSTTRSTWPASTACAPCGWTATTSQPWPPVSVPPPRNGSPPRSSPSPRSSPCAWPSQASPARAHLTKKKCRRSRALPDRGCRGPGSTSLPPVIYYALSSPR